MMSGILLILIGLWGEYVHHFTPTELIVLGAIMTVVSIALNLIVPIIQVQEEID